MEVKKEILEKQKKIKAVEGIARKLQITSNEMIYLVLRYQIEKKYKNIDNFINKLNLENEELLKNPFNLVAHNYSDKLEKELDKVLSGDEKIDDFYGGTGRTGRNNSIVLTPFYVSELMSRILQVNKENCVIDNCCGAGSLLSSALDVGAGDIIGIEYDPSMWALSYLSIALRLDKRPNIIKGDAFEKTKEFKNKADIAIVNPPYNYKERGMPFALEALNNLKDNGRAAVIVQSSVGTGKTIKTNKEILKNHTLVGSIVMNNELFQPFASVETCIYFFKAHKPHDFNNQIVKFADFSDDGIKKTKRTTRAGADADKLYNEILKGMVGIWK